MKLTTSEYNDLVKKHPHLADRGQSANNQRSNTHALGKATISEEGHCSEGIIIFTDVRKRACDDDGLFEKFHLDRLRYEGIIKDDSTKHFRILTTQRKCVADEKPHTMVEIFNPK